MKNIDHNEARILCRRFLEGATSDDEEQRLYLYFRSCDPASDLAEYAPMFQWYDSLTSQNSVTPVASVTAKKRSVVKSIATFSAAAAAVLMLVATVITAWQTADTRRDMMELQGSYIIRNGEKITDLASIYPELKRAEKMVENTEHRISAGDNDPLIDIAIENVSSPAAREALMNTLK